MCELDVCFLWAGKKRILKKIWVATKFIFFSAAAQLLIFRNISYLKETYQFREGQEAPTPGPL